MKKFVRFIVWIFIPASTAFSDALPDIFNKVPKAKLPISVGRNSYSGLSVSSSSSVNRSLGEVPKNEEHYKSIMELHRYLLADQRNDIFSLNNMQWIDDKSIRSCFITFST